MTGELPPYYFRIRDNGAFVFRVDRENRQRRTEMDQIAVVNTRSNEIRPHGDRVLTPEDIAAIRDWMRDRQATLADREMDDIHRTAEQLNAAAQWAQSRASDAQLDEVTDLLLLAMHDLRTVLVRKKADALIKAQHEAEKADRSGTP